MPWTYLLNNPIKDSIDFVPDFIKLNQRVLKIVNICHEFLIAPYGNDMLTIPETEETITILI